MEDIISNCLFENVWFDQAICKGKIINSIGLDIGPFSAYSIVLDKIKV